MLAAWHEEPARIDRARAMLETAAAADAAPETLIELARAWSLTGDFRARAERERAAAYEHGSEAARRAVAAAPRNDRAHLWLAINLGRAAEIKGVMRALALVNRIREESDTVLKLNPERGGPHPGRWPRRRAPRLYGRRPRQGRGAVQARPRGRSAPDRRAPGARASLPRRQALA